MMTPYLVVLVAAAVELGPALDLELSVLIWVQLKGAGRGTQLAYMGMKASKTRDLYVRDMYHDS